MAIPIIPQNQDIFIIAPDPETLETAKVALAHPPKEGAQDIIIGNTNGVLYHVAVDTWKDKDYKVPLGELPDILQQMYRNGTVLAYLPLPDPDPAAQKPKEQTGYYLANFAILNNELPNQQAQRELTAPNGHVYRLPQSKWFDDKQPLNHMFWPGNSAFLLEILNKGSAIAYITKAARTMDCFCYLLNLASLNGSSIFDPASTADPKCEVRTDGAKPSG